MPQGRDGFQPADIHHLRAAQGWLELGLPSEAARELLRLSPETTESPLVLDVRWSVAHAQGDWTEAHRLACRCVELHPAHAPGWINRSYAARRMPGGGLPMALRLLLPALALFPGDSLVPYNLACYACQLHDPERAMQWFAIAEERDAISSSPPGNFRQRALQDEDLAPIHDWIRSRPA